MKAVNSFTGKIISDIDPTLVKSEQIVFPTIGFRAFNKGGKGLIASVMPSNEEFFELPGIFLGGVEFENVAYLFTLNEDTGMGEIGSYPSPKRTSPGFEARYSPLMNYSTGGSAGAFTTKLFNFDLRYPIDVKAKKSFDGSVDLYFIDGNNPDRVINTGFKTTGEETSIVVHDTQFNGALNHVPLSVNEIIVSSISVLNGGTLRPGNYYIYIRYVTSSYAKTSFIKEIGPMSVSQNDFIFTHAGLSEQDWATGTQQITDRKLDIVLDNLDTNYSYFQVGIVRYSATTENGPAQKDVYLINNYFQIDSVSKSFSIYGSEPTILLTFDEIITPSIEYQISTTQVEVDSRLLKANVKKVLPEYDRDKLIEYASKIVVQEFYQDEDFPTKKYSEYLSDSEVIDYGNASTVYGNLGYFKNEIYPFGIVYKFVDGTESEVFPCKGNLEGDNHSFDLSNPYKGLYQFNSWQDAFDSTHTKVTQGRLSGVSFNLYQATYYYRANTSIFDNIAGFYFVRGERIENLLYQGLLLRGYHGAVFKMEGKELVRCSFMGELDVTSTDGNTTSWNPSTAAIMPLFRGYLPTGRSQDNRVDYGVCADDYYYYDYGLGFDDYEMGPYPGGQVAADYLWWTFPTRKQYVTNPNDGNDSYISHDHMFYDPSDPTGSTGFWNNSHGLFSPDVLFDPNPLVPSNNTYLCPLFSFDLQWESSGKKRSRISLGDTLTFPRCKVLDLTENLGTMTMFDEQFILSDSVFVNHLSSKIKNNFTGYMTDGTSDIGIDVYSSLRNRNIGTSKYIGLRDLSLDYDMQGLYGTETEEKLSVVNLYRKEITVEYKQSVWDSFIVSAYKYSKISRRIHPAEYKINQSTPYTFDVWMGDCFLQKVFFRTHRWYAMENPNREPIDASTDCHPPSYFAREYVDWNCSFYQHGLMVGITVESKFNASMRNDVTALDTTDKYLKYTFFPKCLGNGITRDQWVCMEPNEYAHETNQINSGYNKILSDKTYLGYESTEPVHELNKYNRVYASDKHIPGAFLDGYRSIQPGSFQDYALEDGEIFYIGKNLNYPFLVQRSGINQIFLDEQALARGDQGQDIIMGSSVAFLSDKVKKIGFFGTQHKLSVIDGSRGTYGVDFNSRVIWMITTFQSQLGYSQLTAKDLSTNDLIENELWKMFELYSKDTDAVDFLPDDPLHGSGIVSFSNPGYEEIGMTFLLPIIQSKASQRVYRTLLFDERLEGFRGDYPFSEALYFTLGTMLLSQHKYLDDDFSFRIGRMMYRYDIDGSYNTFFGSIAEAKISFIINGLTEKDNTVNFVKVFKSLEITSAHEYLDRIEYETAYQKGVYDFKTDKFYEEPEYLEHKWKVPITVQTSDNKDDFLVDSEMRGNWMKVTFVYKGTNDLELKMVETEFDISMV